MITLFKNLKQTKVKSYTESASENAILKSLLKTIIRKLNGKLTIILSFHKLIYTHLHGKRKLVDTYLTFLSYILILTQLILMKVTRRDEILLLSHVPFFMIQVIVKTGKLAPLLIPSVVHPSNPKSNGQSQATDTTTDLAHNDSSDQTSGPGTNDKTAYEPMPQPPSRQSDNPSTLEINDPTTETFPQNEPNLSRGGSYNLRPNLYRNYSEKYRY